MGELEDTYGSSVNARMASHAGEAQPEPVDDLERLPERGDPPVAGAQWDELHRRWEVWDEGAEAWVVVGDAGDGVPPAQENLLPPLLAREMLQADVAEEHHQPVPDVHRSSPQGPAPPGAQWNEVTDRWERWDEATGAWVEATAVPPI